MRCGVLCACFGAAQVPGQYEGGQGKPQPELHARVQNFDERVLVLASIRKPKRIVIRGHNEKDYPFLVKGGEDLRQDQRIQQLFGLMNEVLAGDTDCAQRQLGLRRCGWLPSRGCCRWGGWGVPLTAARRGTATPSCP